MRRNRFIVSYDIRDPKRLRRVFKTMKGFGYPLQYSVFVCDLTPTERFDLLGALSEVVHLREDRVAIINLGDAEARGRECFEFLGVGNALPPPPPMIV